MSNSGPLSIAEAAVLLGESRSSTARRIDRKELTATRLGKGAHVLDRNEVLTLAEHLLAEREAKLREAKAAMSGAAAS